MNIDDHNSMYFFEPKTRIFRSLVMLQLITQTYLFYMHNLDYLYIMLQLAYFMQICKSVLVVYPLWLGLWLTEVISTHGHSGDFTVRSLLQ